MKIDCLIPLKLYRLNPYFPIIILLVAICSITKLNSQTFEKITDVAGLSILENDNGIAVVDYDKDGDLDFFVVANLPYDGVDESTRSSLFRNENNGQFTDVIDSAGFMNLYPIDVQNENERASNGFRYGVYWGDYDSNGYPDIFFTSRYIVKLFHNEGNGVFTEVAQSADIEENSGIDNTGSTWFDYNNDGFLDLFISEWTFVADDPTSNNRLFKNLDNDTFENVTEESNIDNGFSYHGFTGYST